jgi:Zn-finger nucleic acid-binding protein
VSCRGFWFQNKNILTALAVPNMGKAKPEDRVGFNCPHCANSQLLNFRIENLTSPIISCPKCLGVWVDGGQFMKLKSAVQEAFKKKNTATANANFYKAMGIPENVPIPKQGPDWTEVAMIVLLALSLCAIGLVIYKSFV